MQWGMLRFSIGMTRTGMSRPTSEGQRRWDGLERNTGGRAEVVWKCTEEIIYDWYTGRRVLTMVLSRKRTRGVMDAVRENIAVV